MLIFLPEDEISMFLRKVSVYLQVDAALQPNLKSYALYDFPQVLF
jgi:hypothetical protein